MPSRSRSARSRPLRLLFLWSLRNGPSMWSMANNIREGFVVRPTSTEPEKVIPWVGRPVMKVVGEQYKLRGT